MRKIICILLLIAFNCSAQNTVMNDYHVGYIVKPERINSYHVQPTAVVSDTVLTFPGTFKISSVKEVIVNNKQFDGQNIILYRIKNLNDSIEHTDSMNIVNEFIRKNFYKLHDNVYNRRYLYAIASSPREASKINAIYRRSKNSIADAVHFVADIPQGPSVLKSGKVTIINKDGRVVYNGSVLSLKDFKPDLLNAGKSVQRIKGKLLTEVKGKRVPLIRARVKVLNDSTLTDESGDFTLELSSNGVDPTMYVRPSTPVNTVLLLSASGNELSAMKRGAHGFEYKLLPPDITLLSEIEVDNDIQILFDKFKSNTNSTLSVSKDIRYLVGQFNIDSTGMKVLDQVIAILNDNPSVKLEIVSHTDAQGDDAANQQLSDKRADVVLKYLLAKRIAAGRLSAKGKGETMIRNQCINGVNCSDSDHQYNRRTEFKFTKQ